MARISTYGQDSTLNKLDKVLGTDSLTGQTKNYTIESIVSVVNEDSLVESFDGSTFTYQDYVASSETPTGIINLNAGVASQAAFSAINQIYISVLDKTGLSVAEYLQNADNDFIKISKKGNVNQFGIYEVTAIEDHDNAAYKKLTLTPRGTNGNLTVDDSFFVSNYSALYDQDFSDDSVTEFGDVTNAGSGEIITTIERGQLESLNANALVHGDVVDNVTSTATDVPLSANQGKILKDLINAINTLLTSDNIDLDTLQEVVDYIETNRETLDALSISSITGLQAALDLKQNTEAGKGLSANDFTDVLLAKLNSIAENAEVNVNADWSAVSGDAFIQNKPTDLTNLSIHNATELSDITSSGSGAIITGAERTKLTGIEAGAEVNVQSDWNATTGDSFIQNKPTTITEAQASAITDNTGKVSNVKSDWSETDTNSEAFIQNKPDLTVTKAAVDAAIGVPASDNDDKFYRGDGVWAEAGATTTLGSLSNVASLSDSVSNINQFLFWNAEFEGGKWMPTWLHTYQLRDIINTDPGTAQAGKFLKSSSVGANNWQFAPASLEINDLSDFEITNPQDNQILQYNSTNSEFQNVTDVVLPGTLEFGTTEASTPTFDNGIYYTTEGVHDTLHFRYHGHDISIDKFTEVLPSGILNGGELSTTAGSTTFTIAAGNGIINDLNKSPGSEPHPEIINIEWLEQTITVFNLDSNNSDQLNAWIYVDNTGTVRQQAGAFTEAQFRTHIPVGSVIHTSGTTQFARTFPRTAYNSMSQHSEFIAAFGPLKKSGHAITANGANLSLDRSSGVAFALGRNYAIDPENPSTVSDGARAAALIHRYYSNGSGGFVKDNNGGAGYAGIDPTKYDDGTGTLATVSGGSYAVQRLFYFPGTPNILISYYGKDTYSSLDTAERSYLLESFQEADNTAQQAIYVGAVIMKGNATALNDPADAKILIAGQFRSLAATNLGGVAASAAIGDLTDVSITGVSNDHFLRYNSSSTNWENTAITSDDIAEGTSNLYYPAADSTKVGFISVTQAVDLDTIESDTADNNSKVTFPGFGTVAGTALEGDTTTDDITEGANNLYYTEAKVSANTDVAANSSKVSFPGFGTSAGTALEGDTQFVNGTGTAGSLPKFSDTDTLTDSAISESGEVVDIATTGAIRVPDGTTAERPGTPVAGMFRYNTEDNQFEGYTTEWGAIAGSGGGGSGEIVKETFSGTGSQASFDLSDTIVDIDNINVYVDGVYQYPSNYTVSGNTVTFVSGSIPASGTDNIHIRHNVTAPTLTEGAAFSTSGSLVGDGATLSFGLGGTPRSSDHTMVFLEGVYQEKENYSISGSNIVFTTAPPNGYSIEVKYVTGILDLAQPLDFGEIALDELTGDGTATYALSSAPLSENYTNVYIEGVYQEKGTYSVAGSNIVFSSNVPIGYSIEVSITKTIPKESVTQTAFQTDTFTANGTQTDFALVNGSPASKALTMVFIQGVYQAKSNYNLVSNEIRFTAGTPAEDDVVEVISMSAINTVNSSVTSVNGEVGAVTVQSKHSVSVIGADTNAVANTVYVFTASLTLTLPASPGIGDSIKISNLSGVDTCVLGSNGNKIMDAAEDLTLDTTSASFELIWSGSLKGWVIIGQ